MKTSLLLTLFATIGSATYGLGATVAPPSPGTVRLYTVKCAPCHGPDGAGGVGASFKKKMAHTTTPQIMNVIKNGIPGTAMPASPTLSEPVVQNLALYVEYLNKKK